MGRTGVAAPTAGSNGPKLQTGGNAETVDKDERKTRREENQTHPTSSSNVSAAVS